MKQTVYLPDELAAEVRDELGSDTNISAICQQALRDELSRVRAVAELAAEGFERIEVDMYGEDGENRHTEAFQGQWLVEPDPDATRGDTEPWPDSGAYWGVALTKRGRIAAYRAHCNEGFAPTLAVYDSLDAADLPEHILISAKAALGEPYTKELDI